MRQGLLGNNSHAEVCCYFHMRRHMEIPRSRTSVPEIFQLRSSGTGPANRLDLMMDYLIIAGGELSKIMATGITGGYVCTEYARAQ